MRQEINYSQFRKLGFSEFYGVMLSRALAEDLQPGAKFSGAPGVCSGRYAKSPAEFEVVERDDVAHTITLYQASKDKTITCDYSSLLGGATRKVRTTTPATTNNTTATTQKNDKTMTNEKATSAAAAATTTVNNDLLTGLNALFAQQSAAAVEAARAEVAATYQSQVDELERELEQLKSTSSGTVINVTVKDKTTTTQTDKVLPDCFARCLRRFANNQNIFLYGPAGSGKNVLAEELANALGAKFYYFNTLVTKFDLTGYTDANGVYKTTPLYEAVKNAQSGGESVVMLDEICTGAPEALVCINAALANGYFTFADSGEQVSLERVHFIAADNTNGQGATDEYNGRYKMDESTRDRFSFVHLDYLPQIEESICGDNKDVLNFLRDVRRAAKSTHIQLVCGYRAFKAFIDEDASDDIDERGIIEECLLKGMELDSVRILWGELDDKRNRFARAMGEITENV